MSDQLSENGGLFDIPDGASRIDRASPNQMMQLWIPVEGCQWRTEFIILILNADLHF